MKKMLLFVVLTVLLTVSSVFAQGGIQIINPQNNNSSNMDYLDNVKVGSEYEIEDWGIITIYNYATLVDYTDETGYKDDLIQNYSDKPGADTVILCMDIVNITLKAKNYLKNISVKTVYDDKYTIDGWWVQQDKDRKSLKSSQVFEIDPFYEGHYMFGTTVSDYIMKDSKPLRMVITIDDIELTYNIRK